MEFVIRISQFLLSLSLLIVLHELGHFIPAKAFKTRVEKFYLFFDVKYSLFKKKIGETVYGIGWLPLGGYVKIAGMIDESMDKEQLALPPQPWEFRSKPAWQRLIIMLGGVTVNFILALLIYIVTSFIYGDADIAVSSLKDGYLIENPLLTDLGFKTGDKIVAVNGEEVVFDQDIRKRIIGAKSITIKRGNNTKAISLPEDFLGRLSTSKNRSLFDMRIPYAVGVVPDSSLNKSVDLKSGDVFLKINNQSARYLDEVRVLTQRYKGQQVEATLLRDKIDTITRTLTVNENGKLNIFLGGNNALFEELGYYKVIKKTYGFGESFAIGTSKFTSEFKGYFVQLKQIFTPSTGAYKGVGGFKAIYDIFPSFWSWQVFWKITAFLSIMLGVLNLLPIPALDGGHVMFLIYEMISGRKPGDKFLEYAQIAGFVILITLVLLANGNDIVKSIFN